MGRVAGKVALVTGAASGLGRATAIRLAEEGARVMVTDWEDRGGAETVDLIKAAGGEARFRHQDVSSEEEWQATIDEIIATWGRLDVLVNNAAVIIAKSIRDTTLKDWRWQNSIALDGVFLGVKYGCAAMEKSGGGSIINISSIAGIVGLDKSAAYCAAKGGVRLLTKAAAAEFARLKNGVRVNSVHPGVIRTPGVEKTIRKYGGTDKEAKVRASFEAMSPLGELGEPSDIANGVLYLASDESKYMHGAELVIDAGFSAVR
ncbi:MAG: SDR family oxidoreductase [Gammaproteobacteria bacterium]|nr:SDR family oxidoreductase [Gammaproteobacteria bacterium]